MRKDIIVLGATGSIGKQALSLLRYNSSYRLVGISFSSNIEKIEEELLYFDSLRTIAIKDEKSAKIFSSSHPFYHVIEGEECSIKLIEKYPGAVILNALMGNAGFFPSLKAIENNHVLLLANKESLVIGSTLIKEKMKSSSSVIYPIDSEHVALAKLFDFLKSKKVPTDKIQKVYVTASGGSLRDYPLSTLKDVKKEDVLKHPTWKMSEKITVDSATLVNKGYEVIEASVLFDFPLNKVGAFICRESLIHAKIDYCDKGDKEEIVELSPCDMKVAINYALSFGKEKMHCIWDGDKKTISSLHIESIDDKRYPLFALTIDMFKRYSNVGMIYFNSLDEMLISSFLKEEIAYLDIYRGLKMLYDEFDKKEILTEDNFYRIQKDSLSVAAEILNRIKEEKR